MAERQTVFRWLRKNLAALIAGITLTAITVGTIDASTITVDAIVAGDASLGVTQAAGGIAVSATGAVTVGSATMDLETSDVLTIGNGEGGYHNYSTLSTSGGFDTSTSTFNAGGIALAASGAGDDISIDAADDAYLEGGSARLTLDDTSGAVFTAPITAPVIAAGTAYRVSQLIGTMTTAFTPASTNTEAASSITIPANQWTTTGKTLRVRAWGSTLGNTNQKSWYLFLGTSGGGGCTSGTSVGTVNWGVATDTHVVAEWTVLRSALNTQIGFIQARSGGAGGTSTVNTSGSAARTETSEIIACVGVYNPIAAGDSTVKGVTWEWL